MWCSGRKWGGVSYEKVIVAVLACHGDGRCVRESDSGWRCKGAQVAVGRTGRKIEASSGSDRGGSGISTGSKVTGQRVEG